MSHAAIWGESESQSPTNDEMYPSALLKYVLHQMMMQFTAHGACIALCNEQSGQMEIQAHVRLRQTNHTSHTSHTSPNPTTLSDSEGNDYPHVLNLRSAAEKKIEASAPPQRKVKLSAPALENFVDVSPRQSPLFPVGSQYSKGQDIIGYVWQQREATIMQHDVYLSFFYNEQSSLLPDRKTDIRDMQDIRPTWYLAAPIFKPMQFDEKPGKEGKKKQAVILGVIVLYQTLPGTGFQMKSRSELFHATDRIALYLQNDQLQRQQRRTSEHLQRLQAISTAFPSTVNLANMLEKVYQFTTQVVDVDSMLITFYDRDTKKIYDVFAIQNGQRINYLLEHPTISRPNRRPIWWHTVQEKKEKLLLEPINEERGEHGEYGEHDELLGGVWGDQHQAASFLLLPMKMFNRVIGSLSITSNQSKAYHHEEILVLETMVQLITVSIENAKLYERARQSLIDARQREEVLASMNSVQQSISSVLNVAELITKIAEAVARLVKAEMTVFFQLTADKKDLIAQTIYTPPKVWNDGSELPPLPQAPQPPPAQPHDELIEKIHLPLQGSLLEKLVRESFFYLDASMAEELAESSEEGGAIFLRETGIQKMLMIPVLYQEQLLGILAVHTPGQRRVFHPHEVGLLLAICAQAASAVRNAQLFEEIQEAYAELQRMDSLKDEFLVTASHELRTPLSAISGYATLIKKQSEHIKPEQILRFSTKIEGASQQLSVLVANMTEAAKMGAVEKNLDVQIVPVQLSAIIDLAVNMLRVNAEQSITMQLDEHLWVKGDPLPLRQVMSNLLDNAAKYSPPDGRIAISMSATTLAQVQSYGMPPEQVDHAELIEHGDAPVVLVEVCDEGEGIAPDDRQKIFDKFVRAYRSLTTPIRGTGLGLYICRRYVEAMGGKLWLAESGPHGSVFRFYLFRAEEPDPEPASTDTGEIAKIMGEHA